MNKRSLAATVIIAGIVLIGIIVCAIKLPMYINDKALARYETQVLQNLVLPDDAVVEEYISACCNSSGTGNHTDLYVAVLVKSTVDYETIKQSIDGFSLEDTNCFVYDVARLGDKTLAMEITGISFSKDIENAENYYIIAFNKRAPMSWFDLRGM